MNPDICNKLRELRTAFKSGNSNLYKKSKYNLRNGIKTAKTDYKNKLGSRFWGSDTRHVWQGLRDITDHKSSSGGVINTNPSLPDKLKLFYVRFERENSKPTTKLHTATV